MTMQVGMVGSDGILIASDTQWTDNDALVRQSWNQTKLKINYDCGVVISCAGKLVAAGRLADEIITRTLKNATWLSSEIGAKQEIERKVLPYVEETDQVECLVVFTRPARQLLHFQVATNARNRSERSLMISEQIYTKRFAGDVRNSARFWVERYYPRAPKIPIKRLVPLAAQLITSAHVLNTAGISGLEIVLCDDLGIHPLPKETNSELELTFLQRDRDVGEPLLSETP